MDAGRQLDPTESPGPPVMHVSTHGHMTAGLSRLLHGHFIWLVRLGSDIGREPFETRGGRGWAVDKALIE